MSKQGANPTNYEVQVQILKELKILNSDKIVKKKVRTMFGLNLYQDSGTTLLKAVRDMESFTFDFDFEIEEIWIKRIGANAAQFFGYTLNDVQFPKTSFETLAEITSIICGADTTITTGEYFIFSTVSKAGLITQRYCWIDKDGGGGDPAPAGRTGHVVAVTTGDADTVVAAAIAAVLDALTDCSCTAALAVLTLTNAFVGNLERTVDVDLGAGWTFTTTQAGGLVEQPLITAQPVLYELNTDFLKIKVDKQLRRNWIFKPFLSNTHTAIVNVKLLISGNYLHDFRTLQ